MARVQGPRRDDSVELIGSVSRRIAGGDGWFLLVSYRGVVRDMF